MENLCFSRETQQELVSVTLSLQSKRVLKKLYTPNILRILYMHNMDMHNITWSLMIHLEFNDSSENSHFHLTF